MRLVVCWLLVGCAAPRSSGPAPQAPQAPAAPAAPPPSLPSPTTLVSGQGFVGRIAAEYRVVVRPDELDPANKDYVLQRGDAEVGVVWSRSVKDVQYAMSPRLLAKMNASAKIKSESRTARAWKIDFEWIGVSGTLEGPAVLRGGVERVDGQQVARVIVARCFKNAGAACADFLATIEMAGTLEPLPALVAVAPPPTPKPTPPASTPAPKPTPPTPTQPQPPSGAPPERFFVEAVAEAARRANQRVALAPTCTRSSGGNARALLMSTKASREYLVFAATPRSAGALRGQLLVPGMQPISMAGGSDSEVEVQTLLGVHTWSAAHDGVTIVAFVEGSVPVCFVAIEK